MEAPLAPSASLKKLELKLDVEVDGVRALRSCQPYQASISLPDVLSGEFTLPAGNALNLNTRLGEMARIAVVLFLVASVTNATGVVARVQLESTSSPKVPLNTGGVYLDWNIQTTSTWCRIENLSAGDVIVQYTIGGYR